MTILQAQDLTLGYKHRPVVDGFNVSICQGSVIGLIGPNGSGKTTLLRAFSGLIKPLDGKILLDGQELTEIPARRRAQMIGWVPQREKLAWPLTVKEVVSLGRAPYRGWLLPLTENDQEVIDQALSFTDLKELTDRSVEELSGGEFQRVLVARALAQEPRVLLLDEPNASLDIHYQIQVMDLVRELVAQRGITAVIAIHDLSVAARYCESLILLHHGKKICSGNPQEVLTPEHMRRVFRVETRLYKDPWEHLAVSARNGLDKNE
jgi:ABC-type cobalamin/Fe3+-siderophores transport systems, ATPase components